MGAWAVDNLDVCDELRNVMEKATRSAKDTRVAVLQPHNDFLKSAECTNGELMKEEDMVLQ